jgi:hypothetical protein
LGLAEWRAFRDLHGKPDEEEKDKEEEKEVVVVVRGNSSHKCKAGWWAAAATLLGGGRHCLVGDGGGKEFEGERKVGEMKIWAEKCSAIVLNFFFFKPKLTSEIVAFGCNQRPRF